MIFTPPQSIGSIGPSRPINSDIAQAIADGTCHVPIEGNHHLVCMDGRLTTDGWVTGITLAGGSLTPSIAATALLAREAVTHKLTDLSKYTVQQSVKAGFPVGIHNAGGDGSGCGAMDSCQAIIKLIGNRHEAISEFGKQLGLQTVSSLVTGEIDNGPAIYESFHRYDVPTVKLVGQHGEQAVVVNFVDNTVCDRAAVCRRGDELQVFHLDAWSFMEAARIGVHAAIEYCREHRPDVFIDPNNLRYAQQVVATFNIAAVMILCHEGVRVIPVRHE